MAKNKTGLHKEITSIFDGVPIPKEKAPEQPPRGRTPAFVTYQGDKASFKPPSRGIPAHVVIPKQQPAPDLLKKPAEPKKAKSEIAPVEVRPSWWQQVSQQVKSKVFKPKPGVNSKRQIGSIILVPVLSVILIFVLIKVINPSSGKVTKRVDPETVENVVKAGTDIDWEIPAPYPTTMRNPMQFAEADRNETSGKLTGIVYIDDDPSRSTVIIGGRIMKVGDKVGEAIIKKINKESIEFEKEGKTWTQKVE